MSSLLFILFTGVQMIRKPLNIIIIIFLSSLSLSCASIEAKAASHGDTNSMETYLETGGDIDGPQSWGRTLLIIAAESNQLNMINFLLEKGADPELIAKNGNTVLISASMKGKINVVKLLLEENVNVNGIGSHGSTALHYAASYDRSEIIALLLEAGAKIQPLNDFGYTALIKALEDSAQESRGISKSTEILFEAGAFIDIRNRHIEDIAFTSAESGNIELMDLLMMNGFGVGQGFF